ncbi:MAG: hypothetical protein OEM96_05795 [Gemmatimonadota bacterium]|nr:hypothetical protein [Gemmatimonadota bacterium]
MFRRAAVVGLCLATAGCGLLGPRTRGPDGLSVYDGDLRRLVRQSRFEDALEVAEADAADAGDDLLAALNLALVEHYAGLHESSNARLQSVDIEIEARFTKSVSKAALSLITSDRALEWLPSRFERPMIHVYGALSYLSLDELDEAAVEARRLSRLLDDMGERQLSGDEADVYATLRYFTGAVFEAAGEWNDAHVAYRYAGFEDELSRPPPGTGDVVLLVESGFVANRVEQSVNLLINAGDADYLRSGSDHDRRHAASCLSRDRLGFAYESFGLPLEVDDCRRDRPRSGTDHDHDDDGVAYLLRIAWPVMRRSIDAVETGYVRWDVGSATMTDLEGEGLLQADLSGAAISDFNSHAAEVLIKAVARAAVKYAVVDAVADDSEVAQVLGNAVTALLERADTRSWTLLPSNLHILRMSLPAGNHRIVVELGTGRFAAQSLVLDDVLVESEGVTVVSTRAWP